MTRGPDPRLGQTLGLAAAPPGDDRFLDNVLLETVSLYVVVHGNPALAWLAGHSLRSPCSFCERAVPLMQLAHAGRPALDRPFHADIRSCWRQSLHGPDVSLTIGDAQAVTRACIEALVRAQVISSPTLLRSAVERASYDHHPRVEVTLGSFGS